MKLQEIIEKGSITVKHYAQGFIGVSGRFVVSDPSRIQDDAWANLVQLRDDIKNFLKLEKSMSVTHTRHSYNLYKIDARHSANDELRYTISLSYASSDNLKIIPVFSIETRKNDLPQKVDDDNRELFPEKAKQYAAAVQAHNTTIQDYFDNLTSRLAKTSES